MSRFGSMTPGPAEGEESGFDVLLLRMERRADGSWAARTTTFLAPLGRPIDVHVASPGRILVLEYTRPTNFKGGAGWLPGRILELTAMHGTHGRHQGTRDNAKSSDDGGGTARGSSPTSR